jgi:peptide/nickel transport system substrate-binding protein
MEPRPYNPEKAKKLLAEAGFPNGFEIAMQGTRRYLKGGEVAQAVASQFEAIGVKVKLEIPEWTVYIQQVPAGKQAPIYMLAWGSTQTLDADAAIYAIYKSDEPYSTVKSPKMDELLDKTRSTIDPVEREKLFHEIQKLAYEEVPCLTLYQQDTLYGMRSNVDWKGRADARVPVFDIRLK